MQMHIVTMGQACLAHSGPPGSDGKNSTYCHEATLPIEQVLASERAIGSSWELGAATEEVRIGLSMCQSSSE